MPDFVLTKIITLDQILDKKYGKKGQPKREQCEQQFETFRLGVILSFKNKRP